MVVVAVIWFLSGIVPKAEMARFTPFILQFFALHLSTLFDSRLVPSLNQTSLSPLPHVSSRSSLVILTFSCHSFQDLEQLSKHYCHSSSAPIHTILSIYCFLQSQHVHLFFSHLSVYTCSIAHDSYHSYLCSS